MRALVIGLLLAAGCACAQDGDAERGRALIEKREAANCTLCHAIPGVGGVAGTMGPSLAGVGARYDAAQLRARIADPAAFDARAAMPAYFRTEGLARVAPQYRGATVLSARELDDVVAYLRTLK